MEYDLIRQSRKTVGLYLRNGGVEVRAPYKVPKAEIDRFVASKEKWITGKLAAERERQAKKQEFTVDYGGTLLWRGSEYPLLGDSADSRIWFDEKGFHFPPGLDEDTLKHNTVRLYKILAKNHLAERVRYFAGIMGDTPSKVKVTDAKTRWGSCSKRVPAGKHNPASLGQALRYLQAAVDEPVYSVNFSWRLCMAEDALIDAVVVHELAHIKKMNHSADFYAAVKAVLPDYDERNAKLKLLARRLGCENWDL